MLGLGLSIPQVAARGSRSLVAAIRSLFAANEPGVWYDPSDLSTLYQDAAGTTPVTAVEQPVGLMLDKSKGLALGPELVTGILDSSSNWTLDAYGSVSGDALSIDTPVSTTSNQVYVPPAAGTFAASKHYRVSFTVTQTRGTLICGIGSSPTYNTGNITASGTYTFTIPCGGAIPNRISFSSNASAVNNFIGTITNISVREIPGNHAYQTTTTSRPVLSARYNLLTKTEQFDDAAWNVKLNVTFSEAKVIANTVNAEHRVGMFFTSLATSYIHTYRVKPAGLNWCFIRTVSTIGTVDITYFDLQNRAVGTKPANVTAGISAVGDGSYDIYVVNPTGAYNNYSILGLTNADGVQIFAGNGVDGIEVYRADLRVANAGANLPPYQRVNTATDYDTDPAKFKPYLRFDGVDDWLVTNTITPGIDKAQVFAGVRKLSDPAIAVLVELSASATTGNAGAFLCDFEYYDSTYKNVVRDYLNGNVVASKYSTVSNAPSTIVRTSIFDISQSTTNTEISQRVNGSIPSPSGVVSGSAGTGNFGNYPLYIGRRGGTTFPFNGHLYSLIVRFGNNLPIETIEKTEEYVGIKTGVTL